MGAHRTAQPSRLAPVVGIVMIVAAVCLGGGVLAATEATRRPPVTAGQPVAAGRPVAAATGATRSTVTSATPIVTTVRPRPATTAIERLVREHGPSGISVAVHDPASGRTLAFGARHGLTTASVVKLNFLEVLLLRHQQAGTTITDDEDELATAMITQSDNGAADRIFNAYAGGHAGVDPANRTLGLRRTVLGPDDYWGLTRTGATDQVRLLRNLVEPAPLTPASRTYALGLLRSVDPGQRWGVTAAADRGSRPAVKNGWLDVDDDGGRWAVGSVGIVTVGGRPLLLAVLTQHNPDLDTGIRLVERLAVLAGRATDER